MEQFAVLLAFLLFLTTNSLQGQDWQWAFLKGYGYLPNMGVYGTKGVAAPLNKPGARGGSTSCMHNGKLYLFGGNGHGETGNDFLNDLWEYNSVTGNWTWLSGSKVTGAQGTYNTKGVEFATSMPGARREAVSWIVNNKLYLFGGYGVATGKYDVGNLNDLWEYNFSSGNWIWISGSSRPWQNGVYGTQGEGILGDVPGGRTNATAWEYNGKLYLFGGNGSASSGYPGDFNDLWVFDPATKIWTWLKGSSSTDVAGMYGSRGTATSATTPGARNGAMSWAQNNKLYLFGGYRSAYFNDLWEYDPATNNWRWLTGSSNTNVLGTYGTKGVAASSNTPGARQHAVAGAAQSKLYLFGGFGKASFGSGSYNDFWEYDISGNTWKWITGSNSIDQPGVYGSQGVSSASTTPGAREYLAGGCTNDKFFVFGGTGFVSSTIAETLNDLWEFDLTGQQWRWLKGLNRPAQQAVYGTAKQAAAENLPGQRLGGVTWSYNGKLYLFGGEIYITRNGNHLYGASFNDFWEYDPALNHWRWLSGSSLPDGTGVYGTLGVASSNNTPGARSGSYTWQLEDKLYLFGGWGEWGYLNDLWEYNLTTGNWRCLRGSSNYDQAGVYGTKGTASSTNTPGGRAGSACWSEGNKLYLFGGYGNAASYDWGALDDIWEYNLTTSQWKWINGSKVVDQPAVYGTTGVASSTNSPGGRSSATAVSKGSKLYIFGEAFNELNDLWEYDSQTNNWRCLKGNGSSGRMSVYGTLGIEDRENLPGARGKACGWEHNGKLYFFGGYGFVGNFSGNLNDLWEFNLSTGNWRWVKGNNVIDPSGSYLAVGAANMANNPGGRGSSMSWKVDNKLYLFGGRGIGVDGDFGDRADLWVLNLESSALNVDLMDYKASAAGDKVNLSWTTASESNNKYFTIERSLDGKSYSTLAKPSGAGTKREASTYTINDPYPAVGINYYRLSQTDFDGKVTELGVRAVSFKSLANIELRLYPNPVAEVLHIEYASEVSKQVEIVMHDLAGKLIFKQALHVSPASVAYSIDLKHKVSAGEYVLTFNEGNTRTSKIIVVQ